MSAHLECRAWVLGEDERTGCFLVCEAHHIRQSFGSSHDIAKAATVEHNRVHHAPQPPEPFLSVIYDSVATGQQSADELAELLRISQIRNRAFAITGMLLAEDGWFLQALEGPASRVDAVMRKIAADPRHSRVRVLEREMRPTRRFPDWAMARGYIGAIESRPLANFYEAMLLARGQAISTGGNGVDLPPS